MITTDFFIAEIDLLPLATTEQLRRGKLTQVERLLRRRQDPEIEAKLNVMGIWLLDYAIVSGLVALRRLDG